MYRYSILCYTLGKTHTCKRLHDINQKTRKKVL